MADTKNAHIRKGSTGRSPEIQVEEAKRLLDDPAFQRAFDAVREGMINEIVNFQHDGQPQTDAYEREVCRTLRTLHSLRKAISLGVQRQELRLADFRSINPNEDE